MQDLTELKLQIATGVRMLVYAGLLDMNGHLSCRVPDSDEFLINSRRASRAALTTADVVRVDLDGNLIEGESEPPSEFHIHASLYRRRMDVSAVLHHHPHWQTVLGIARQPMLPVFSVGAFISPSLPVFETSSLINSRELGDQVAAVMADADVMTIRHHGAVVAAQSVQDVFARAVFVEENAKKQYYASLLGEVEPMSGINLARARETNWTPIIGRKVWNYYEQSARLEGKLVEIGE